MNGFRDIDIKGSIPREFTLSALCMLDLLAGQACFDLGRACSGVLPTENACARIAVSTSKREINKHECQLPIHQSE